MDFQWEFFENLQEFVYVTDLETNELVYLNAYLRKNLGFQSVAECAGKKCYQVLQGRDSPCSFCTNDKLQPGKFYEWLFQNPILNRTVLIKDTMVERDQRKYRLEIAVDTGAGLVNSANNYFFVNSDFIVNECLQRTHSTTDSHAALMHLLAYIGEKFQCGRTYIFEKNKSGGFDNTYEWCAPGVAPQKDMLQNEPAETIDWWLNLFENGQVVVIDDVESIREEYPLAYAALKPQKVKSLVTGPLRMGNEIIGFFGVDNPSPQALPLITPFLQVMDYFIVSILKRRDLVNRLEYLSYHDQLTGALNRNALSKIYEDAAGSMGSVGVIYCDISDLKTVNDHMGHKAGDDLIVHCYGLIRKAFEYDSIYRTGGDEFVVICMNISAFDFDRRVEQLNNLIREDEHHIAVGSVWSDHHPLSIQQLITTADEKMYQNKRDYYSGINPISGQRRDRRRSLVQPEQKRTTRPTTPFSQFIQNNYYDPEALFQSWSMADSPYYLYFGDLQTNVFYISDNMRERFGFQSNIVTDLLNVWAKKISNKEDRTLYENDISDMMHNRKEQHNLRYRVKDCHGENVWIHCRGIMKWDEERRKPLFFSGSVYCQEQDFVIDAITNFPREYAAVSKLTELKQQNLPVAVIGIGLNHFSEINETQGRSTADELLSRIASRLSDRFGHRIFFYRLDGMRFMGIVTPHLQERMELTICEIRKIVEAEYGRANILVRNPCSFGLLHYPEDADSPQALLENIISLISMAKSMPNQEYLMHSPQNILRQKRRAKMALELSQNALNDMTGFYMTIQPIVEPVTERIVGGEILLRWRFQNQDISPAEFVPMLEKSKLILPVGQWAFEQTVRICKRILACRPEFYLSFNVSYLQILDDHYLPFIRRTLEKYRLDASHLVLELTETHFDETPEKLKRFVDGCKQLGMRVALDDFGNGYSSLGLLLRYPANIVKLDRSLLSEITRSKDKLRFIRSIVYACHQFGKLVCVEGVENEEELSIIRDTGCDMIQGFYYYHPMEPRELLPLLMDSPSDPLPEK